MTGRALPAAAVLLAGTVLVAACGGRHHHATHHTTAPALTYAQGAAACNDLSTWIPGARNQGEPRFSAVLHADETLAVNSTLGSDLATEDSDLQQVNGLALSPDAMSNQQGDSNTAALSSDCAAYGVTLNWGG